MRVRWLLTLIVVLVVAWPSVGHAQNEMPPGVSEATATCLSERLGPSFSVTRVEPYILVDGVLVFALGRAIPEEPRAVQFPRIGRDEINYWFDDDPLWPPVSLSYSAPMAHGARDLRQDPLWIVGLGCLESAYPRTP